MEQQLKKALERAHGVARGVELWPGYRIDEIPIGLYFKETAYLVGHPSPPPSYSSAGQVADRPLFQGPTLPEMAGNTAAEVAGYRCALVQLPADWSGPPRPGRRGPTSRAEREALIAEEERRICHYAWLILHEAFHVFQLHAHGAMERLDGAAMAVMARYPESDPANNAMAILENRLLVAGLQEEPGAVGRFLAVRLHRQKRLARLGQADVARYEQIVECVEGTPTYVELKAGRPVKEVIDHLLVANHGGKWAAYRRFYDTGAAQALLLDRSLPGWQHRLSEGGVTLQSLLEEVVAAEIPPVGQVVQEMGFAAILEEEERYEVERRGQAAALLQALNEGQGIGVEVLLPPGVQGVLWDPTNLLNLEPGRRLHTRFCGAVGPGGLRIQIEGLCLEEWQPQGRRFKLRLSERPQVLTGPGAGFQVRGNGLNIDAPSGRMTEGAEGLQIQIELTE